MQPIWNFFLGRNFYCFFWCCIQDLMSYPHLHLLIDFCVCHGPGYPGDLSKYETNVYLRPRPRVGDLLARSSGRAPTVIYNIHCCLWKYVSWAIYFHRRLLLAVCVYISVVVELLVCIGLHKILKLGQSWPWRPKNDMAGSILYP